jgi:hypothetical protein
MTTSNFNLRGIQPEIMSLLRREAKEQNISMNFLILKLVEQGIGYSHKKRTVHHELDGLSGTWSIHESKEFEKNSKFFEQIDKEFWI